MVITLEFGLVSNRSPSDKYNGGHPTSLAMLIES
jgi:hypothetical protein